MSEESMNSNDAEYGLGTIYGTEHPWFWKIHITALISLGDYIHILDK